MKRYYRILKRTAGKEEDGRYYIFRNGAWQSDDANEIFGRLIGYDPSEPPDSPYAVGSTDILDTIEEISSMEAIKLTGGIL